MHKVTIIPRGPALGVTWYLPKDDRHSLSKEQAESWLTALNDLRLVLGTRLGVTEEMFLEAVDPRDPRAPEMALYVYLSWLQEQLVEALEADLQL